VRVRFVVGCIWRRADESSIVPVQGWILGGGMFGANLAYLSEQDGEVLLLWQGVKTLLTGQILAIFG